MGEADKPRLHQLLMQFRDERNRDRAWSRATARTKEPIILPRVLGTGKCACLQPDARDGPGMHGRQLWVRFEGGSPAESSSSEVNCPSPDAAIDIWSSIGAPNETLGNPWDGTVESPGSRTEPLLQEEWNVRGDWPGGKALTVTLRSPRGALAEGSLVVATRSDRQIGN